MHEVDELEVTIQTYIWVNMKVNKFLSFLGVGSAVFFVLSQINNFYHISDVIYYVTVFIFLLTGVNLIMLVLSSLYVDRLRNKQLVVYDYHFKSQMRIGLMNQLSELAVIDNTGDTKYMWDIDNLDEVNTAKDTFDSLKRKNYLAYTVNADGEKGVLINTFDSTLGKIIMIPPVIGG